jgi:hypothetical protein
MSGVITAFLNESGTRPEENEAFTILVIGPVNTFKNFFRRRFGVISSGVGRDNMTLRERPG